MLEVWQTESSCTDCECKRIGKKNREDERDGEARSFEDN